MRTLIAKFKNKVFVEIQMKGDGKEAYTKEMEQQVSESPDRTIFCYRNDNRWFAKNTVSLSPKAWVFEDYMIKEIIIE